MDLTIGPESALCRDSHSDIFAPLPKLCRDYQLDLSQHNHGSCYNVRIDVFHREQGFPLETEIDDLDPGATHFLLRLVPSLKPIGTIRGIKSPEGYYKLSRLAVLKDYRQFKFGRKLVLTLHDWVKSDALVHRTVDNDVVRVISHSQLYVKGFYAKFGYVEEGEEFDEDGDPHQKMVLHLPISTPQGNSNGAD